MDNKLNEIEVKLLVQRSLMMAFMYAQVIGMSKGEVLNMAHNIGSGHLSAEDLKNNKPRKRNRNG